MENLYFLKNLTFKLIHANLKYLKICRKNELIELKTHKKHKEFNLIIKLILILNLVFSAISKYF